MIGRRCCLLLRRCHDVPIRCCGDVPVRCLGEVPLRCHWVFHLRYTCDVAGTCRETSLRRHYDALLQVGEELCLMALKIDAKFEEKLSCVSKNDIKNLANFHLKICRGVMS